MPAGQPLGLELLAGFLRCCLADLFPLIRLRVHAGSAGLIEAPPSILLLLELGLPEACRFSELGLSAPFRLIKRLLASDLLWGESLPRGRQLLPSLLLLLDLLDGCLSALDLSLGHVLDGSDAHLVGDVGARDRDYHAQQLSDGEERLAAASCHARSSMNVV